MKSWRTTLGGLLVALGTSLRYADPPASSYADLLVIVGSLILGGAARDNNVTSEQAGIKPKPTEEKSEPT